MIMRGSFLMGALVGAAAATFLISRKNNMNMARMGTMVTNAIGDGFKLITSTSQSQPAQSASANGSANKQNPSSQSKAKDKQASMAQLEQMIASDAEVKKEVDKILSKNTH